MYLNPFVNGPPTRHTHGELHMSWDILSFQITPMSHTIAMTGATFRQLDEGGRFYMAQRLLDVTRAPVVYVRDASHPDRYLLGAVNDLAGGGRYIINVVGSTPLLVMKPLGRVQTEGDIAGMIHTPISSPTMPSPINLTSSPREQSVKVRRPANAWILYRSHYSSSLKKERPDLTNNAISRLLSTRWHGEDAEVRQYWKSKAEEVKRHHAEAHPTYQYRPRRPVDIKRRPGARKNKNKTANKSQSELMVDTDPWT